MKKISLFMAFIMLFLCGCNSLKVTPYLRGISFIAEIEYMGNETLAHCKVLEDGSGEFIITEPEELNGLTLRLNGNKFNAEYLGLCYETDKSAFPITAIYDALTDKNAVLYSEDEIFTEGETEKGEYKLYLSGQGLPLKLEVKDGITAEFKNVTILK